jgi:DNA-binding response OmpR family regulator
MARLFKSILVVEDDENIRESLRDILTAEGYTLFEAENGRVALELINEGKLKEPCLILLDLMMPEMNGWEFLEARRKQNAIASIPTIVFTAVTDSRMPKGAIKILKKPFDLNELIRLVESHCGQEKNVNMPKEAS